MKLLLALLLLLAPLGAQASGWFSNASCAGTALAGQQLKISPGKDAFNCVSDTNASAVVDVTGRATMTFYGTAPTVTINRCTDSTGTKCEIWWQMVNTSCVVAAADPCNHAEVNSGFYTISISATEANALVSIRGNN